MTTRVTKQQGKFILVATGSSITLSCLACKDSKKYLYFVTPSPEEIDSRLMFYRLNHVCVQEC